MIQQQVVTEIPMTGGIFNFMEYKMRKPFFPKPLKLIVGSPINETYTMIKNIVYMEKQILALKKECEPDTIILVEAKIEDGQLVEILQLNAEYMSDIICLLQDII